MRLAVALTLVSVAAGFSPAARPAFSTGLHSTTEYQTFVDAAPTLDADGFKSKLAAAKEKMSAKDQTSKAISDLKVVHEDEHVVVVDKPAGTLSVPGKAGNPSVQQAVFDKFGCESGNSNHMVSHRLGMDTSGLMVFARTSHALRDLNAQFRTRKVSRQYEALLCGHVADDSGVIDMPLMMDYEYPPYMTVSTDDRQRALIGVSAEEVGKKVLENPKASVTKYEVIAREELDGNAVTRVVLTSVTGRTHQLNVHCAAFGHPIVGDKVYGVNGEARPNGGADAVGDADLQSAIASAHGDKMMCVHAKSLGFRHPESREDKTFDSAAPF